jgi:hypothetical protein
VVQPSAPPQQARPLSRWPRNEFWPFLHQAGLTPLLLTLDATLAPLSSAPDSPIAASSDVGLDSHYDIESFVRDGAAVRARVVDRLHADLRSAEATTRRPPGGDVRQFCEPVRCGLVDRDNWLHRDRFSESLQILDRLRVPTRGFRSTGCAASRANPGAVGLIRSPGSPATSTTLHGRQTSSPHVPGPVAHAQLRSCQSPEGTRCSGGEVGTAVCLARQDRLAAS